MRIQFEVPARLERPIKVILAITFAAFFIFIGLSIFYEYTSGTVPNSVTGEIYPLSQHGHTVYLSPSQHRWLETSESLALFFIAFFVSMCAYAFYQHKRAKRID